MEGSKMYEPSFKRGKRCILLCEGYYEWQRFPSSLKEENRPVYFIHMKQPNGVSIVNKSTWTRDKIKLMHIAGIFDFWKDLDQVSFYSFTILSMPSDGTALNWLHPRIPIVLETEAQIANWLNFGEVSGDEAVAMIQRPCCLEWHQVSSSVENRFSNQPMVVELDDDDDEM